MDNQTLYDKVNELEKELTELKDLFYKNNFSSLQVFTKNVEMKGQVKIGSLATSTIAFYGVTGTTQAGAITAPSGGATQDSQARTAINSIITAIKNIGITA